MAPNSPIGDNQDALGDPPTRAGPFPDPRSWPPIDACPPPDAGATVVVDGRFAPDEPDALGAGGSPPVAQDDRSPKCTGSGTPAGPASPEGTGLRTARRPPTRSAPR